MIGRDVKSYCKEDISLIENYDKAINDKEHTWDCHHRDEIRTLPSGMKVYRSKQELIDNGRYYNCPANELIFLTASEHQSLHKTNRTGWTHSEDTKKNMRHPHKFKYKSWKIIDGKRVWYEL